MANFDHQLPPHVVGLLKAGIQSRDLASTFEQYGQQRMASRRIRSLIRASVAYPLLILVILVPLLLFLSLYVIPMFGDLFKEFGIALPEITLVVLRAENKCRRCWWA